MLKPRSSVETDVAPNAAFGRADWKRKLPALIGRQVVLREPRSSDAASLSTLLGRTEVSRFVSPPPSSAEAFLQFVARAELQRAAGAHICYVLTLKDRDRAIGVFQVRSLGNGFETADWGFAIGSPYWGTGVFLDGAELVLEFAFATLGVHRLEARVAALNGRGNRALVKVGAVQEAVLRKAFIRNGRPHDQLLYSILEDDWRRARSTARQRSASAIRIH